MNGRVVASERPGHSILEGLFSHQQLNSITDAFLVPNPLGVVAVLSAFNFPVAVYGWLVFPHMWYICANLIADNSRNLALSMAAGNATIWKPSPTTPLCSIAVTRIVSGVLERNGIPGAVAGLVTGGKDVGSAVVESKDVDLGKFKFHRNTINLMLIEDFRLVSFTGSEHVGRIVGKTVMSRFGKVILELGGNNGQFASAF